MSSVTQVENAALTEGMSEAASIYTALMKPTELFTLFQRPFSGLNTRGGNLIHTILGPQYSDSLIINILPNCHTLTHRDLTEYKMKGRQVVTARDDFVG